MNPIQSPVSIFINLNPIQKLDRNDFIKLFSGTNQESDLLDSLTDILSFFKQEKIILLYSILSNAPEGQRKDLFTSLAKYMNAFGPKVMKLLSSKTLKEQVTILQIFGGVANDHLGLQEINLLLEAISAMDLPQDVLLFIPIVKSLINDSSHLVEIEDSLTFIIEMTEPEREKLMKYIKFIRLKEQGKSAANPPQSPTTEERKKILSFFKALSEKNFKSFLAINQQYRLDLMCLSEQQQKFALEQLMQIPEEELEGAFYAIKRLLSYVKPNPDNGLILLEIVSKMSKADRIKIVDLVKEFPRQSSLIALMGFFLLPNLQVADRMSVISKKELCHLAETLLRIHGPDTLNVIKDVKPFIVQGMGAIDISKISCLVSRLSKDIRKEALSVALEMIDDTMTWSDQLTVLYLVTHMPKPLKAWELTKSISFNQNMPWPLKISLFLNLLEQPHLLNASQLKFQVVHFSTEKQEEMLLDFNEIVKKIAEVKIDGSADQLQKTYELIQSEMKHRLCYIPQISTVQDST